MKIYLASPLGFSELGSKCIPKIRNRLESQGHEVHDPWDEDFSKSLSIVYHPENTYEQTLRTANNLGVRIGATNRNAIDECQALLAVLDGQELDSGTASEVGYAVGKGKPVYGYRGDIRNVGELPGTPFNVQVYSFIELSGGKLFRSIRDIEIPW